MPTVSMPSTNAGLYAKLVRAARTKSAACARSSPDHAPRTLVMLARSSGFLHGRTSIDIRDHAVDIGLFEHDIRHRQAAEQALRQRGGRAISLITDDDAVTATLHDHPAERLERRRQLRRHDVGNRPLQV